MQNLAATGVDVHAVTAWALLGSFDWDCLLTRESGHYEPGAFCVKGGEPRPTALAGYIRSLTSSCETPVEIARILSTQGWWRQPHRLLYGTQFPIASLVA